MSLPHDQNSQDHQNHTTTTIQQDDHWMEQTTRKRFLWKKGRDRNERIRQEIIALEKKRQAKALQLYRIYLGAPISWYAVRRKMTSNPIITPGDPRYKVLGKPVVLRRIWTHPPPRHDGVHFYTNLLLNLKRMIVHHALSSLIRDGREPRWTLQELDALVDCVNIDRTVLGEHPFAHYYFRGPHHFRQLLIDSPVKRILLGNDEQRFRRCRYLRERLSRKSPEAGGSGSCSSLVDSRDKKVPRESSELKSKWPSKWLDLATCKWFYRWSPDGHVVKRTRRHEQLSHRHDSKEKISPSRSPVGLSTSPARPTWLPVGPTSSPKSPRTSPARLGGIPKRSRRLPKDQSLEGKKTFYPAAPPPKSSQDGKDFGFVSRRTRSVTKTPQPKSVTQSSCERTTVARAFTLPKYGGKHSARTTSSKETEKQKSDTLTLSHEKSIKPTSTSASQSKYHKLAASLQGPRETESKGTASVKISQSSKSRRSEAKAQDVQKEKSSVGSSAKSSQKTTRLPASGKPQQTKATEVTLTKKSAKALSGKKEKSKSLEKVEDSDERSRAVTCSSPMTSRREVEKPLGAPSVMTGDRTKTPQSLEGYILEDSLDGSLSTKMPDKEWSPRVSPLIKKGVTSENLTSPSSVARVDSQKGDVGTRANADEDVTYVSSPLSAVYDDVSPRSILDDDVKDDQSATDDDLNNYQSPWSVTQDEVTDEQSSPSIAHDDTMYDLSPPRSTPYDITEEQVYPNISVSGQMEIQTNKMGEETTSADLNTEESHRQAEGPDDVESTRHTSSTQSAADDTLVTLIKVNFEKTDDSTSTSTSWSEERTKSLEEETKSQEEETRSLEWGLSTADSRNLQHDDNTLADLSTEASRGQAEVYEDVSTEASRGQADVQDDVESTTYTSSPRSTADDSSATLIKVNYEMKVDSAPDSNTVLEGVPSSTSLEENAASFTLNSQQSEAETKSQEELPKSQAELTKSLEEQTWSQEELTKSLEEQTWSQEELTKSLEKQTWSQEELTKSLKEQTWSQDELTKSLEEQIRSQEELTKSLEEQTWSKEELTKSLEEQTWSQEELTKSLEEETQSQEKPSESMEEKPWSQEEDMKSQQSKEETETAHTETKTLPEKSWSLEEETESSEEIVKSLEEKIECSEKIVKSLEEKIECSEEIVKSLDEEMKCSEEIVKSLEEEMKCSEEIVKSLEEEMECSEEIEKSLEKEIVRSEETVKSLEKETKNQEEETQSQEEETKSLETETKSLEEETKSQKEETKSHEEEANSLREETKRLVEETKSHEEETKILEEETKSQQSRKYAEGSALFSSTHDEVQQDSEAICQKTSIKIRFDLPLTDVRSEGSSSHSSLSTADSKDLQLKVSSCEEADLKPSPEMILSREDYSETYQSGMSRGEVERWSTTSSPRLPRSDHNVQISCSVKVSVDGVSISDTHELASQDFSKADISKTMSPPGKLPSSSSASVHRADYGSQSLLIEKGDSVEELDSRTSYGPGKTQATRKPSGEREHEHESGMREKSRERRSFRSESRERIASNSDDHSDEKSDRKSHDSRKNSGIRKYKYKSKTKEKTREKIVYSSEDRERIVISSEEHLEKQSKRKPRDSRKREHGYEYKSEKREKSSDRTAATSESLSDKQRQSYDSRQSSKQTEKSGDRSSSRSENLSGKKSKRSSSSPRSSSRESTSRKSSSQPPLKVTSQYQEHTEKVGLPGDLYRQSTQQAITTIKFESQKHTDIRTVVESKYGEAPVWRYQKHRGGRTRIDFCLAGTDSSETPDSDWAGFSSQSSFQSSSSSTDHNKDPATSTQSSKDLNTSKNIEQLSSVSSGFSVNSPRIEVISAPDSVLKYLKAENIAAEKSSQDSLHDLNVVSMEAQRSSRESLQFLKWDNEAVQNLPPKSVNMNIVTGEQSVQDSHHTDGNSPLSSLMKLSQIGSDSSLGSLLHSLQSDDSLTEDCPQKQPQTDNCPLPVSVQKYPEKQHVVGEDVPVDSPQAGVEVKQEFSHKRLAVDIQKSPQVNGQTCPGVDREDSPSQDLATIESLTEVRGEDSSASLESLLRCSQIDSSSSLNSLFDSLKADDYFVQEFQRKNLKINNITAESSRMRPSKNVYPVKDFRRKQTKAKSKSAQDCLRTDNVLAQNFLHESLQAENVLVRNSPQESQRTESTSALDFSLICEQADSTSPPSSSQCSLQDNGAQIQASLQRSLRPKPVFISRPRRVLNSRSENVLSLRTENVLIPDLTRHQGSRSTSLESWRVGSGSMLDAVEVAEAKTPTTSHRSKTKHAQHRGDKKGARKVLVTTKRRLETCSSCRQVKKNFIKPTDMLKLYIARSQRHKSTMECTYTSLLDNDDPSKKTLG